MKKITIGDMTFAGFFNHDVLLGTGLSYGAGALSFSLHLFPFGIHFFIEHSVFNNPRIARDFGLAFIKGAIFRMDLGQTNHERAQSRPFIFVELAEFLGQKIYSEEFEEEGKFVIEMPEGDYDAKFKTFTSIWNRPFGFKKEMRRITISIEDGIPVPKRDGEDMVYSATLPLELGLDMIDAKIAFIQSINNHRVKDGGASWTPDKHEADKLISKLNNKL